MRTKRTWWVASSGRRLESMPSGKWSRLTISYVTGKSWLMSSFICVSISFSSFREGLWSSTKVILLFLRSMCALVERGHPNNLPMVWLSRCSAVWAGGNSSFMCSFTTCSFFSILSVSTFILYTRPPIAGRFRVKVLSAEVKVVAMFSPVSKSSAR